MKTFGGGLNNKLDIQILEFMKKIGQNIEKSLKTQNPHHFKHMKGPLNIHEFFVVGTLQRMEGHPKQNLNYFVQTVV